jgi:prepilin-type N-terminal cleavage/methylation domain-containing protein
VGRGDTRAFTLIELMVVVVLVGVLTVLAIPTMAEARYNARTFDNATQIAEIFREARTRAMGRGAAMLVGLSSGNAMALTVGASDLGTFTLYEGQVPTSYGAVTVGGPPLPGGSPLSSCAPPAVAYNIWPLVVANAATTLMDQVNLNNNGEVQAQIWTTLNDGSGTTPTVGGLCYTPLGRMYYQPAFPPVFTAGVDYLHGAIQITVQRSGTGVATATGLKRTVIVPDSGSTRIVSQ